MLWSPFSITVAIGAVAGLPVLFILLYLFLSGDQRRLMRAIRQNTHERGWRFHIRRWLGDPTAFQIDGGDDSACWTLKSGPASAYCKYWTVQMKLRFPAFAGRQDLMVEPRNRPDRPGGLVAAQIDKASAERIGRVSSDLAGQVMLERCGREQPSGLASFDAVYKVVGMASSVVDETLAAQFIQWPAAGVVPHSILAWRDHSGLRLEARMPGPPDWASVVHFIDLGRALSRRLPPPVPVPQPRGWFDCLMDKLTDF